MLDSIRQSAEWSKPGGIEETLASINNFAQHRGGRVERDGHKFALGFGSRGAYKF
jgi:hypothetical protein